MTRRKTYKFGIFAERIAAILLIAKGYKILHRRYKTHYGEIDIIAKKSNYIVFIEVKARKIRVNIEEILTVRQVSRIKRAGHFFLSQNPILSNFDVRFDFIEINGSFLPKHHLNFLN